jgi:hypothetical protein
VKLGYNNLIEVLLNVDNTTNATQYYHDGNTAANIVSSNTNGVSAQMRLPYLIYDFYQSGPSGLDLCDVDVPSQDCDWDDDGVYNDLVVDWSVE